MDKPTGGELEYDLLNTLVTDEAAIAARTAETATDNPTWGICRCRMAAIIEATARLMGWGKASETRCVALARWPGRCVV